MLSFCLVFSRLSRSWPELVIRFSFFLFRLVALHAVVGLCLAHADTITLAHNLHEDGKRVIGNKSPILLLFTAEYCPYCDEVKASVFSLISTDPAYRDRMLLREVRIDTNLYLVGFGGVVTSHRSFSENRGIRIVPTLEFLDGAGKQIRQPLVGVSIPDYYGAYVDNGIEQAIRNLRARRDPS